MNVTLEAELELMHKKVSLLQEEIEDLARLLGEEVAKTEGVKRLLKDALAVVAGESK